MQRKPPPYRPDPLAGRALRHTPLFALDAVALDTEATGLDPRSARIVEIGAVRVSGSEVDPAQAFRTFVAIEESIPPAATAVHGIRDADLLGAPDFKQAFANLVDFIGERPVVGHTIGFDVALLTRECAGAGLSLPGWPVLDIRLLAQLAAPALADFSLEGLAAYFRIEVRDRHRALGDAILTARIFLGLVPLLQGLGVRTFGEAEAACRRLASSVDPYLGSGAAAAPGAEIAGGRADTYPYRHFVHQLMSSPPAFCASRASVAEALAVLAEQRIGSLFIGEPQAPASALAIVTERDILRALAGRGADALGEPVATIASQPLITIPEDAYVYEAIGRMRRHRIRHLAAVGQEGRVAGALSARDLLRFTADTAVLLGEETAEAGDVVGLARAWAKVPALCTELIEDGMSGRDVAAIVAGELRHLTRRAGELAMEELAGAGAGPPPCAFALVVLGSAGRGESLLALDQDNALIFATGEPDGPEDRWFKSFGERVNRMLHEAGVPLCPGGVMAGNSKFRGSLQTWRERVGQWVGRAGPEDLLNVDIFFDLRPVLGDAAMADRLWNDAWDGARGAAPLLRLLAETGPRLDAPFGLFGRLRTEQGRIDLKRFGLWPIVHSGRLMALRHGVKRHPTAERLDGVRALGIGGARDLTEAAAAFDRFLRLTLRSQLADLAAGRPAVNRVPRSIVESETGYDQLRSDLRLAASLGELARDQIARVPA